MSDAPEFTPAPQIVLPLTPLEANQVMDALNVAVKAAPNALEQGSQLIPIAAKLGQAVAAFNAQT